MKGIPVAVLDRNVPARADWEENVHYYQCDVSDFKQVSDVARQIEKEVRLERPVYLPIPLARVC